MGRYFEYRDWEIEDICNNIRKRIMDSKKPIPLKVKKYGVSIIYRTSETSYQSGWNRLHYVELEDKEQAIKFLDNCRWLVREGENMWVDDCEKHTYINKDGITIPYHFEIREYEYECYEDGNDYVEYSDEEKQMLRETLYNIEKARVYLSVYDHCSDQYSFGDGNFSNSSLSSLEKFEKEYSENLPIGYEDENE